MRGEEGGGRKDEGGGGRGDSIIFQRAVNVWRSASKQDFMVPL